MYTHNMHILEKDGNNDKKEYAVVNKALKDLSQKQCDGTTQQSMNNITNNFLF